MLSLSFRFFVESLSVWGIWARYPRLQVVVEILLQALATALEQPWSKAAGCRFDGSSTFSCSSSIGSGAFSLVEIECQIAISIVMVQIMTTIIRTIRAVVGIMPSQRNNREW